MPEPRQSPGGRLIRSSLRDNPRDALSVIQAMLREHVSITGINIMTMDFTQPPAAGRPPLSRAEDPRVPADPRAPLGRAGDAPLLAGWLDWTGRATAGQLTPMST